MRSSSRAAIRVVAFVVLLLVTAAAALGQAAIPRAPALWVTDTAGLLSTRAASDLNDRLRTYERETGHQILVYIAPTTGGVPIEDWAVRAFAQWKVGRKGLDDGLVLFVFPRDRTLRIEVGYGLEPKIPDASAARILRETIEPGLRAGRPDEAVTAGVDRLLVLANGEASGGDVTGPVPLSAPQLIAIALVLLILFAFALRSPRLALWLLLNIVSRRGGGGFSGGSGFSGGGGRSGGGGASGRW